MSSFFILSAPILEGQANRVSLAAFGSVGQGGDDSGVIQSALNVTAQAGQVLEFPAGLYLTGPLNLPSNSSLLLDPGAVVRAVSGYQLNDRLLSIMDAQNISIQGTAGQSVFQMLKGEYGSGEYRHCLGIYGSSNIHIDGIQCNDSGGDGVYIGEGSQGYSASITITNSGFNNNRRQGLSLVSATGVYIGNCTFTNTNGTLPSSGIDIEPNQGSDLMQNIRIENNQAIGNAGNGISFALGNLDVNSAQVSIDVYNYSSQSNGQSGFFASSEPSGNLLSVPGYVAVNASSSLGDSQYGVVASYWDAVTFLGFTNLTIVNANGSRSNIDGAAIAIKRGGGSTQLMGNVHFFNTSIIDTVGNLGAYFTVYDWSHVGITQLQFLNGGQISGGSLGTGLYEGVPATSLNIN